MLENRLPSQFTLLSCYEKKNKGNLNALTVVLQNIIIIIIAVWQHLDGPFQCFGLLCMWQGL